MYNIDSNTVYTVNGVEIHNLISVLGCNILGGSGASRFCAGNISYSGVVNWKGVEENIDTFKKELISSYLLNDADYGQVLVLNTSYRNYPHGDNLPKYKELWSKYFDLIAFQTIKGGHGNRDCLLIVLDLRNLRNSDHGLEPTKPQRIAYHDDEDEEE